MKLALAIITLAACWRTLPPVVSPASTPRCGSEPTRLVPTPARGDSCRGARATLEDGRVLVVGEACASLEGVLVSPPPLPVTQTTLTAIAGNQAVLVGGLRDVALRSVLRFDANTQRWQPAAPLHEARFGHGAVALRDGRVLVTGGCAELVEGCSGESRVTSYELYDPRADRWTRAPLAFGQARTSPALVQLADGRVLALGGSQGDSLVPPPTMVWDGAGWCAAPPLVAYRHQPAAELQRDGESVLVTGLVDDGGPAAELYRFAKDCPCKK